MLYCRWPTSTLNHTHMFTYMHLSMYIYIHMYLGFLFLIQLLFCLFIHFYILSSTTELVPSGTLALPSPGLRLGDRLETVAGCAAEESRRSWPRGAHGI